MPTDFHNFNTPADGTKNWDVPLDENFRLIDSKLPIFDLESNLTEYEPKLNARFVATDTGTVYDGDGDTWNEAERSFGNSNPKRLSNIRIVGPDGFDSLQTAHDDLPAEGGLILLTKNITETGIELTKPVKVLGSTASSDSDGGRAIIDTSGGNGIWNKHNAVVLEDIAIVGDNTSGTGSYGLKHGVSGSFQANHCEYRNVRVFNKGDVGVLVTGRSVNCEWSIHCDYMTNEAIHFHLPSGNSDYCNNHIFHRLLTNNSSVGIRIDGGGMFAGNTISQWDAEFNDGAPIDVGSGVDFAGNSFEGYGSESNGAPWSIPRHPSDQTPANTLDLYVANLPSDFPTSNFSHINIRSRSDLHGYNDPLVDFSLLDDWGDDQLKTRSGMHRGRYIAPEGEVPGVYRPTWTGDTGSVTASGGAAHFAGGSTLNINTTQTRAVWDCEVTFSFTSVPSSGRFTVRIDQDTSTGERYYLEVHNDGSADLKYADGSGSFPTIISGTWPDDTAEHTVRATADEDGNRELFVDDTSQGTATDTRTPSAPKLAQIWQRADTELNIHRFSIT